MGILGKAWGTAEELLHPRDRFGRFAKKRAMPEATGKKVLGFLDRFNPRTFQSDGQAAQYLFNRGKPGRFEGEDLRRLHFDWDEANDHIRAGDIDPETQRYIDMMDRATIALPEQIITTKTVGPEAFGLTPEQLDLEEGGLRDVQGRLFADLGYSAAVVGTPQGTGPGRIAITIATPRGTKAIIPARSGTDRGIFYERGQRFRMTKIKPDGTGGWTVMAIAEPAGLTPEQVPEPLMPGRRGAGLSEAQRRERITPSMTPQQKLDAAGNPPMATRAAEQRGEVPAQPAPAEAAPAPVSPSPVQGPTSPATGVPERQEAVQTDSVGPTATKGTSPAEIAQGADEVAQQAAEAQAAPAPATPESFRVALATTDLKSPSRGKRQKEFDDARVGIVSGKQQPQDALRQLDTDIEVNKRQLERQKAGTEKADPELEQDIKDQEALADLISSHHGVPRRGQGSEAAEAPTPSAPAAPAKRATKTATKAAKATPATKAAPAKKAGPTPTPGAPSTARGSEPTPKAAPKKAGKRPPADVAKDIQAAGTREEAESHLEGMTGPELTALADHMEAPHAKRATKDQLRRAIMHGKNRQLDGDAIRDSSTRQRQEAGTLTDGQKERIVNKAKAIKARKPEADFDDEDRRIVGMADEIEAGGTGEVAARAAAKKAVTPGTPEAKKAAPAKAVAKKATPAKAAPSPVDAEEEAFKARVSEAGLPDRVTALRAMAKEQKIRGFSTMNKKQLQQALLGDEVKTSNKIGVVSPAKMVPHLEAAESDQAARALLEKHTLVDLKALAKERGIKLPSRGATKGKVTDMVLEDIRGPQEGIGGRTPDTSLTEDLDQLGYIDLPGANGDKIKQEISQIDGDDPESLRTGRDNLEKLSKQFRSDGDKNSANMAQAAADAMGMRAQTISGVEEQAPPVKRVAKKAAPELPEGEEAPEVERSLEKMLKPELLDLARREGAAEVRPSWSKARILDEIKKNRRMDSSRGPETEEERLRRELGALPGGAERDLGPNQGPLRLPDRAPTDEEIARDNPDLDVRKLFNDAGIPGPDPGGMVRETNLTLKQEGPKVAAKRLRTEADRMIERIPEARAQSQRTSVPFPGDADTAEEKLRADAARVREVADKIEAAPPVKKATKKAAKKAVADVDRASGNLAAEVRSTPAGTGETFGDILRRTDAEELRQEVKRSGLGDIEGKTAEEIFDNTIKKALEDRMRELGMLPEDPKKPTRAQKRVPKGSVDGPKTDVPITTPDRGESFIQAWDAAGLDAPGTAGDSLREVRRRIWSGDITPEEGVRLIENDIAFQKDDLVDLDAELRRLRGSGAPGRAEVVKEQRQLREGIKAQEKASDFIRSHFKNEAPITREELEVKLDPEEKAAFDRIKALGPEGVADLKRGAKEAGLGDIEGDDLDTVTQNIARKMADQEMAARVKQRLNEEKEQTARDTQAEKDKKRTSAEAIAGIESVMDGSDRAVTARIKSQSKISGLSPETQKDLLDNAGDREGLQRALDRIAAKNGLFRIATRGENSHFDPETHEQPPGGNLQRGDPITVLETGWRSDVRGVDVRVKKAKVTEGHSPVVESLAPEALAAPAKKALPGAAPGTAAGRITAGRIAPGHRIMVTKMSNGEWGTATRKTGAVAMEVTEVRAGAGGRRQFVGRDDSGNEITLTGVNGANRGLASHQTVMLEPPPKAPKVTKAATKAAPAVPETSTPEAPATEGAGKFLPPLANGTPRKSFTNVEVGDVVKRAGSKGNMQRVVQHDRPTSRGGSHILHLEDGSKITGHSNTAVWLDPSTPGAPEAPEAPPAKNVAKAAVPAKAAPKAVDLDNPTRHNAELIGTGLDLDPKGEDRQWLDVVQRDLDRGMDGRQIADGLRREADSQRTLHNIQESVGGTEGASPAARINRMELMADRLEGVRPIPKPEAPKKAAGSAVIPFDTHQAAQAASKARGDLRAGKSHAEVATALRTAATGVGSRDHDPTPMSRVGDPTPSEKSAMKRGDAKKLRELAAEIQAEGVAQRAAAKAAKKAAPAKKATPRADLSPEAARATAAVLSNPENISPPRPTKAAAPKKRTAAEMRRAQALAGPDYPLEQVLADWDRQKEERKNLTGPVGEMIVRQMDDALRRLNEAKTPGREDDALAGLLAPELRQLAIRLGVPPGGSKAEVARKIIDRVKGREAPGASAERAVPKAAKKAAAPRADLSPESARATADVLSNPENISPPRPGSVNESVPMQPYSKTDNMRMHVDSPTMGLVKAYEAAGRNGSANQMLDLRRRATEKGGATTPQQVVDELKAMRAQETDPKIQRQLDRAIEANDAPMTPVPDLPANTPPAARDLVERLHTIPYARKGDGSEAAAGSTHGESLVDQVAAMFRQLSSGELRQQPSMLLRQILTQKVHEMNEPSFRIWELADLLEPVTDAQGRKVPSPLTLALREMRGGGTGKA